MNLRKKIYDNRWFIWTIVLALSIGFGMWGAIEVTIAKMDQDVLDNNSTFLMLKIRNMSDSDDLLDVVVD